MAEKKTYINVPFAQKDAAKALGAKWDAAVKKWYVPADTALEAFAQWSVVSDVTTVAKPSTKPLPGQAKVNTSSEGVLVPAIDKDFVAYQGEQPPWA